MESRKRRLRVFQSLAEESSPVANYSITMNSFQDPSTSLFSHSSASSLQAESSVFTETCFPKPDPLNQTFSQVPYPQNYLHSKLASTFASVSNLADKFSRTIESKKSELKSPISLGKKTESFKPSQISLSTEDSSKEETAVRGKPKKRPLIESEKKFYVVRIEMIRSGLDTRTTIMIKNIPNKYTQKMLLNSIDKKFLGSYDFLYLPIDFKNKCNVGYAFINFLDYRVIAEFYLEFNEKRWEKFNSEKVCAIAYGRIQGLNALVQHFQNSSVINQDDNKVKPVIISKREG